MAKKTAPQRAGDPVAVDPKDYTVELENEKVRVLRIRYGPREKSEIGTWSEDMLLFFARRLPFERGLWFTFGPIMEADGHTVDGIFCPCTETTERVVSMAVTAPRLTMMTRCRSNSGRTRFNSNWR
jgi:hypothetical protein